VRTMSGSFSMCSPSKVKGSILSSSRGNWESVSKLTSPTPAKELVSSFDKLGGDSPVTAGQRKRKVLVRLSKYTLSKQTSHKTACKNSGIIYRTKAEVQRRNFYPHVQPDELQICQRISNHHNDLTQSKIHIRLFGGHKVVSLESLFSPLGLGATTLNVHDSNRPGFLG